MDDRVVWLMLAAICVAGVIILVAVRRPVRPLAAVPVLPVPARAPAPHAVARTHFADGGGYVDIGGVVAWASADPALRILPGHLLHYEPNGDGHTVAVAFADDSAPEDHRP